MKDLPGLYLGTHERLTDLAVVPREKPHTGAAAREQPRDSPVIAAFFIVQLSHPYIHVSLSVLVLSEYTPRSGIAGFIPVLVGFFCKYLFID